jgi:transposase-like protein
VGKLRSMEELFSGRHFDREVIILCVRWYLRYKLSFRDLVEIMAERGVHVAHTTILRWVQHYAPEFIKRWNRFRKFSGKSWRVDETYIKVRGEWTYLYRAVDKAGQTVDFRLSKTRDVEAAKAFFRKAIRREGRPPQTITLDGYAASHRAVREMKNDGLLPGRTKLRSSKYLNNRIEQDHRGIKSRTRPMLGFKSFSTAAITIAGVELLRRIHKAQFSFGRLRLKDQAVPALWNAVLAA